MEDKVLVRVRASMSGQAFDFKIPYDIQVKDITPTMKQMFCKVSEQKLPDLRIPRNFPVYILSQGAVLLGMLLISLLIGTAVGLATKSGDLLILV